MTSKNTTYSYSPGHCRTSNISFKLDPDSAITGGSGQGYKTTPSDAGLRYFVKLYNPYREHEWDRDFLARKHIFLSNTSLENCYDPWHRESRAYERIDERIHGNLRSLFPKYYGTGSTPSSRLPDPWRRTNSDVHFIVLESVEKVDATIASEVKLSEASSTMARLVYAETKSCQDVHVFIHFYEMIETLHQAQIIHGHLKHDNLLDYSIAQRPVLLDFSRSWTYQDDLPCLEPFKRKPWTLEQQCSGELLAIKSMVLVESRKCKDDQMLRRRFPSYTDCQRCAELMQMIVGAEKGGLDSDEGESGRERERIEPGKIVAKER